MRDDGTLVWSVVAGGELGLGGAFPINSMSIADESVFISGSVGVRGSLSPSGASALTGAFAGRLALDDGQAEWRRALDGDFVACAAPAQDGTLYGAVVTAQPPHVGFNAPPATSILQAVDGVTGLDAWSVPIALTSRCGAVATDDAIVVAGVNAVTAYARSDGAELWRAQTNRTGLAATRATEDSDDILVCEAAGSGSVIARISGAAVVDEAVRTSLCTDIAVHGDKIYVSERDVGVIDDARIAVLDAGLVEQRMVRYGGAGVERALGVDVDDGRAVLTGDFRGRTILDAGTEVRPHRGDALVIFFEP